MNPGGVRIGTPAITSRGMNEKDMLLIAEFLSKVTKICLDAQNKGGKNLKQFLLTVEQDPELEKLGREVKVGIIFLFNFFFLGFCHTVLHSRSLRNLF